MATREGKSSVIYLKVVNTSGSMKPVQIQIDGGPKLKPKGEAVVLAGKTPEDTNSMDKPENVIPHTERVTGISSSFSRDFPPYSITVLRLKAK